MTTGFLSTGILEAESGEESAAEDFNDGGYATGSEGAPSFASSVFDYRYENGRRYHGFKEGKYVLPNDEIEQNRLDIVHHTFSIMLDGQLHIVPFEEPPSRILDVGTGTGIWAIDVATQYPSAEVIGTDLSPIQPNWVPPNCRFEIDDAECEWIYSKESFDFIHSRHMIGSISNWPEYIGRIYDYLKPGGWVQLVEHEATISSDDGTYHKDTALHKWFEEYHGGLSELGLDWQVPLKLQSMVEAHGGFTDIKEVVLKLPWGAWCKDKKLKELGRWASLILDTGLEAYGMALFTRVLGRSREEMEKLFENARKEVMQKKVHAYQGHRFLIARKKGGD